MLTDDLQHRQIRGPVVARLITELEARHRNTVTIEEVAAIAGVGLRRARELVADLRAQGWLRTLPIRGSYEFLPAATGPLPSGNPWLEFQAALKRHPQAAGHVGLGSAAFARGIADRRPTPDTVIWRADTKAPPGLLQTYRIVLCAPRRYFGTQDLHGLPVASVERIATEVALWPGYAGDLHSPDHWLATIFQQVNPPALAASARQAGPTATGRLGYLAQVLGAPEAVIEGLRELPRTRPVWLGPRHTGARYDAHWGVYDSLELR